MKNTIFLLMLCFVFSCKNSTDTTSTDTTPPPAPTVEKVTISDFTPSPSFPDAKIETVGYKQGKFNFGISGDTYKLGMQTPDAPQKMCANSAKGQHIHLIVNNEPYAAKYDANFDYDLPDGTHHVLAFLSRSYHESIKTDDANVAYVVQVKDKAFANVAEIEEPMLFYSRPKGTYVGKADTEKLMLDFYLKNVNLSADGYKVQVDVNGETVSTVDTWKPYFLNGLPMGENTVKLTLLNADGTVAAVPLNPVERTFTLKADPVEGN